MNKKRRLPSAITERLFVVQEKVSELILGTTYVIKSHCFKIQKKIKITRCISQM